MPTKYLICGSRNFKDRVMLNRALNALILHPRDAVIIHGDCSGVDRMAGQWGDEHGAKVNPVPADWAGHGMSAGPIRNGLMLELKPDVVIAFPGGKGTQNMINQARLRRVVTIQVIA
jgi:hypothetical protein